MVKPDDKDDKKAEQNKSFNEKLHEIPTLELLRNIQEQGKYLIQKEIDLAKAELKAEIKTESIFAGGFAVGIAAASVTGLLLLVTIIFALSLIIPGWAAGLIVSGVFLFVSIFAFVFGWSKRVKDPFVRTKEVLKADTQLAEGGSQKHAA